MDELPLAVPAAVDAELPDETVEPVDVNALLVPVDPLLFPNTAMPVSSRRLCGGKGTVRERLLPFAARLVAVEAVLLALVDGAHEAVVPAASTVPTPCKAAVPVLDPVWESVPLEALPLLTEVTLVLAVTLPLAEVAVWLAEDVPVPLVAPAEP
jgi:hypothetical protein